MLNPILSPAGWWAQRDTQFQHVRCWCPWLRGVILALTVMVGTSVTWVPSAISAVPTAEPQGLNYVNPTLENLNGTLTWNTMTAAELGDSPLRGWWVQFRLDDGPWREVDPGHRGTETSYRDIRSWKDHGIELQFRVRPITDDLGSGVPPNEHWSNPFVVTRPAVNVSIGSLTMHNATAYLSKDRSGWHPYFAPQMSWDAPGGGVLGYQLIWQRGSTIHRFPDLAPEANSYNPEVRRWSNRHPIHGNQDYFLQPYTINGGAPQSGVRLTVESWSRAPLPVPQGLDYTTPTLDNRTGTLTWDAMTAIELGNSPLSGWWVQYRLGDGAWQDANPPAAGTGTSYTDANIWKLHGTPLQFRVRPVTADLGVDASPENHWSAPSVLNRPAVDLVPGSFMLNTSVTYVDGAGKGTGWHPRFTPRLSWVAPAEPILGYQVYLRRAPDPTVLLSELDADITHYDPELLRWSSGYVRGGNYEYFVYAYHLNGAGPRSRAVLAIRGGNEAPPAPPQGLQYEIPTLNNLRGTLTWAAIPASDFDTSTLRGWWVQYRLNDGSWRDASPAARGTDRRYVDSNIWRRHGTELRFRVRSITDHFGQDREVDDHWSTPLLVTRSAVDLDIDSLTLEPSTAYVNSDGTYWHPSFVPSMSWRTPTGEVLGYRLFWRRPARSGTDPEPFSATDLTPTATSYGPAPHRWSDGTPITGGIEYLLQAYNLNGGGPRSTVRLEVDEWHEAPLPVPQGLRYQLPTLADPNGTLTWTAMTAAELGNSPLQGWGVQYRLDDGPWRAVNPTHRSVEPRYRDPRSWKDHGTVLRFRVRPITDELALTESPEDHWSTPVLVTRRAVDLPIEMLTVEPAVAYINSDATSWHPSFVPSLSWNAPAGSPLGYRVLWRLRPRQGTDPTPFPLTELDSTTTRFDPAPHRWSGGTPITGDIEYLVQAYNIDGGGTRSATILTVGRWGDAPLPVPQGLSYEKPTLANRNGTLTWDEMTATELGNTPLRGWRVQFRMDDGPWWAVSPGHRGTAPSYRDPRSWREHGTQLRFRVRPVTDELRPGDNPNDHWSEPLLVTRPAVDRPIGSFSLDPNIVFVDVAGRGSGWHPRTVPSLTWGAPGGDLLGFQVFWRRGSGAPTLIENLDATATHFNPDPQRWSTGHPVGGDSVYRVQAYTLDGAGTPSTDVLTIGRVRQEDSIEIVATAVPSDMAHAPRDCFQVTWELDESNLYPWARLLRASGVAGEWDVLREADFAAIAGPINQPGFSGDQHEFPAVTDCPPTPTTTLTYRVEVLRQANGAGEETQLWTKEQEVSTPPGAPTAMPTGLAYAPPTESLLQGILTWTAMTEAELGHSRLLRWEVQYRFDNGSWQAAAPPASGTSPSYTDTTIWKQHGELLEFRVRPLTAYLNERPGMATNYWSEAPYPMWYRMGSVPAVGALTLNSSGAQLDTAGTGWNTAFAAPHLSWVAATGTVLRYRLLRRPAPAGATATPRFTVIQEFLDTVTSHELLPPTDGSGQTLSGVFEYQVQAFNRNGGGLVSNSVRLTVAAPPAPVGATSQPPTVSNLQLHDHGGFGFAIVGPAVLTSGHTHTFTLNTSTSTTVRYGGRMHGVAFDAGTDGLARWVTADEPVVCRGVQFCVLRPAGAGYGFHPANDRPSRWLGYWRGGDVTDGLASGATFKVHVPETLTANHAIELGFAQVPAAGDPMWLVNADPAVATQHTLQLVPAPGVLRTLSHEVLNDNRVRLDWEVAITPAVHGLRLQRKLAEQPDTDFARFAPDMAPALVAEVTSIVDTPTVPAQNTLTYEYRLGTYNADGLESWFAPRVRATVPGPHAAVSAIPRFMLTTAERLQYTFDPADPDALLFTFNPDTVVAEAMPLAQGGQAPVVYNANDLAAVGLQIVPPTQPQAPPMLVGTTRRGAVAGTLRATDHDGDRDELRYRIVVGAPPAAPPEFMATADGADRVALAWTAPPGAITAGVTGYRIEESPDGMTGNWAVVVSDTQSLATTYVHTGLQPETTVHYRVAAVSSVGVGDWSASQMVTTAAAAVPGVPTAVRVVPTHQQLTLHWAPPVRDGGALVTGYRIQNSGTGSNFELLAELDAAARSYPRDHFFGQRTEYFRVAACNSVGCGPTAAVAGTSIAPHLPAAPTALAVDDADRVQQLRLTWTAPSTVDGLPIVGYRVQRRTGGGTWADASSDTGTAVPTYVDAGPDTCPGTNPLPGLCAGREYEYRVAAITAAGIGADSDPITAATAATGIPGPPERLRVWRHGHGETALTAAWVSTVRLNGVTDFEYAVRWRPTTGSAAWGTPEYTQSQELLIQNLTAGTTYEVQVATVPDGTRADPSQWGNWSAAVTATTHGGAQVGTPLPALTHVRLEEDDSQLSLDYAADGTFDRFWVAASYTGPFECERLFAEEQPGSFRATDPLVLTLPRTNGVTHLTDPARWDQDNPCLLAGTAVTLRVRVARGNQFSPDHFILRHDFADAPPAPPRNLMAHAQVRGVDLHWEPPLHSGNTPLTGYLVERCDPPDDCSVDSDAWGLQDTINSGVHRLAVIDAPLEATTAWFRVRARNANPDPDPTTELPATLATEDCLRTELCTTNLSVPSDAVAVTLLPPPARPDPPYGLTAQVTRTRTLPTGWAVVLGWQAPLRTNDFTIQGYRVERARDLNVAFGHPDGWQILDTSLPATARDYTDRSPVFASGMPTYYRVTTRSDTDSAPSAAVAMRLSAVTEVAPTGVIAFPGRNAIQLEWSPPTVPSGTAITGYRIEHSPTGAANSWEPLRADTGGTRTHFLDSDLPTGTTRHYRVAARNALGDGDWSATTMGAVDANRPGPPQGVAVRMRGAAVVLRWTAPAVPGGAGAAIIGYRVDRSTNGGTTWHIVTPDTQSTAPEYLDMLAPAGVRVMYRVFARNGPADANLSRPAGYTSIAVVDRGPPWPRALTVTPALRRHMVEWNAVETDGGHTITGYRLEATQSLERPLWVTVAELDNTETTRYERDLSAELTDGTELYYRILTVAEERDSEYSGTATASVWTAAVRLDFDGDGDFDGQDALLMYYAHALADAVGDGNANAGFPGVREQLVTSALLAFGGGGNTPDDVTRQMWFNAALSAPGPDSSLDLNRDSRVNDMDAQVLLYALGSTFQPARDHAPSRLVFLRALAPTDMPTDADLQGLLEEVYFLSGQ